MNFRVATLNTRGIAAHRRRIQLCCFLKEHEIDVCFLQETTSYHWTGSGLACVFPPGVVVYRQQILWPGKIAVIDLTVRGVSMTCVNAHVSHAPEERCCQLQIIAALANKKDTLILGDLNISEESAKDLASGSAEALAELLDQADLVKVATFLDAELENTRVAGIGSRVDARRLARILFPLGFCDHVIQYQTIDYTSLHWQAAEVRPIFRSNDNVFIDEILEYLANTSPSILPNGRASGWNGLACEFAKAFEDFFAEVFWQVFEASRPRGALPSSSRRSKVILLPKSNGGPGLQAFRPISLPTTDYRILSGVLMGCLRRHLPYLREITHHLPSSPFDTLSRSYLFALLEKLGLPSAFLLWITVLYGEADAAIRIRDVYTRAFPLLNGRGLYADDIVLFIRDDTQFELVPLIFEELQMAYGVAVNFSKSCGLWCSSWRHRSDSSLGIFWTSESLNILGCTILSGNTVVFHASYLMGLLERSIARWSPFVRGLSLVGRARAANCLVLGSILHHLHGCVPPETTIGRLQARLARFVWGTSRVSWLPEGILARPVSEGGVGLLDIASQLRLTCLKGAQASLRGAANEVFAYSRRQQVPAAARLAGSRPRLQTTVGDFSDGAQALVRSTRAARLDAQHLGIFCQRLLQENANSRYHAEYEAETIVLRGSTTFITRLNSQSARRALDASATPSPSCCRAGCAVGSYRKYVSLFFWADLRRNCFSRHDAYVAIRLVSTRCHILTILPRGNDVSLFWRRYVDDILCICKTDLEETILSTLNSYNPNLSFTMEKEQGHIIPFLDILIIRTPASFHTTVYYKNSSTPTYTHFYSFCPIVHKINIVKTLTRRLHTHCSLPIFKTTEKARIISHLTAASYPLTFINKHTYSPAPSNPPPVFRTTCMLPYSPLTVSISRLIRPFGIRTFFINTPSIHSLLRHPITKTSTQLSPLDSSGAVYSVSCEHCSATYVGETGRTVAIRMSEHTRNINNNDPRSLIYQHVASTGHSFNTNHPTIHYRNIPNLHQRLMLESIKGCASFNLVHLTTHDNTAPRQPSRSRKIIEQIKESRQILDQCQSKAAARTFDQMIYLEYSPEFTPVYYIKALENKQRKDLPKKIVVTAKGGSALAYLEYGFRCSKCYRIQDKRMNCPRIIREANTIQPSSQKSSVKTAPPPNTTAAALPPAALNHPEPVTVPAQTSSTPPTQEAKAPETEPSTRTPETSTQTDLNISRGSKSIHCKSKDRARSLSPTAGDLDPPSQPFTNGSLTSKPGQGPRKSFRLACFNVRGIAARHRSIELCYFLEQHEVDVAFIQETNVTTLDSVEDLCLGYRAEVVHSSGARGSGLACIFSSGVQVIGQRFLSPGKIVAFDVIIRGIKATIINFHLSHTPDERLQQLQAIIGAVNEDAWVLGDFNISEESASDNASGSVEALGELLDRANLVDAAAILDAAHLQTRISSCGSRVDGGRLDRVLLPSRLSNRVTRYWSLYYKKSCHRAVLLQIGEAPEPRPPCIASMLRSRLVVGTVETLLNEAFGNIEDMQNAEIWRRARKYVQIKLVDVSIDSDYPSLPDLGRVLRIRCRGTSSTTFYDSAGRVNTGPVVRGLAFANLKERFSHPSCSPEDIDGFLRGFTLRITIEESDSLHRYGIGEEEIVTAIGRLQTGKEAGWDDLPCELFRDFEDLFASLARLQPLSLPTSSCYRVLSGVLYWRLRTNLRDIVPECRSYAVSGRTGKKEEGEHKSKVKLDEILSLADSKGANIICLQETKLKPNHHFKVKGFKILRKDRPSADGGGGLLTLIKDLSFEEIDTPSTTHTELQAFKIHLPNQRPLTIVNTYHPPQKPGPELDLVAHLLGPNILILGDFNSKHQSWGCSLNNTEGSILSTFIDDNNLTIVSNGPTYISHSYGTPQTLYLTITSPSMQQFIKNSTLKSIGSDHLPLLTEISTSTSLPKYSQRHFWNYKKASWNSFKTLLDSLLSKIPPNSSLEDRWKNWESAVLISAKQNIPRGKGKFYIPGYREVLDILKDEIEDRNQVYQDLIENNNTLLIRDYNHLAAKIKLKADQIKQNKWIEICSSIDPKTSDTKLWRLLHALNQDTASHSSSNTFKDNSGNPLTDKYSIANHFAHHYSSTAKLNFNLQDKIICRKSRLTRNLAKSKPSHNNFSKPFQEHELDEALSHLDPTKAPAISPLSKCTIQVKINNIKSKTSRIYQGLPQGSILSPILFNIYLNDVHTFIKPPAKIALYADDIIIWVSKNNLSDAEQSLNKAMKNLQKVTQKLKLSININKSEIGLFTINNHLRHWTPNIFLNNSKLQYSDSPRYLGVTPDPALTFKKHIDTVISKAKNSLKILKEISGLNWGANANILRTTYLALVRPILEYATPAWINASKTNLSKIDRIQASAAKIISGLRGSCPNRIAELESNLLPLRLRRKICFSKYITKKINSPKEHLTGKSIRNWVPNQRLKRPTPLNMAHNSNLLDIPINPKHRTSYPPHKTRNKLICFPHLPDNPHKHETQAELLKAIGLQIIEENSSFFDITIYTDGSQLETGLSGSGIAIYKDKILEKISLSHTRHLSVYKSELSAIDTALKDININSQEPLLKSIAKSVNRLPANSSVTVQWYPAHVGIPGNELADSLAKAGALGLPEARESTTQLDERDLLPRGRIEDIRGLQACVRNKSQLRQEPRPLVREMEEAHRLPVGHLLEQGRAKAANSLMLFAIYYHHRLTCPARLPSKDCRQDWLDSCNPAWRSQCSLLARLERDVAVSCVYSWHLAPPRRRRSLHLFEAAAEILELNHRILQSALLQALRVVGDCRFLLPPELLAPKR
ncbi:hypothetical protein LAZ67_2003187 [Cordylochernes scorpioides]|uniref:Uncharacterized protein n=1 Tax=Cordylochernes scorpioides TaxID=51811 RepID=A0ABY6K2K6_9ARAC|nr:hypothetical protein LAZ67_2003187 [Cordylochernes scorpioides]